MCPCVRAIEEIAKYNEDRTPKRYAEVLLGMSPLKR